MSMQTEFVTLVGAITAGRVYPMGSATAPVAPYITYTREIAIEQTTLDANGGTGNAINTRFQVDIWSMSYGEAQSLAAAVKSTMKGWAAENVLLGDHDFYEADTKLHRVMLDYSIWHM